MSNANRQKCFQEKCTRSFSKNPPQLNSSEDNVTIKVQRNKTGGAKSAEAIKKKKSNQTSENENMRTAGKLIELTLTDIL